jgi:hypothetical protein
MLELSDPELDTEAEPEAGSELLKDVDKLFENLDE